MTHILIIGVVATLAVLAILSKTWAGEPKKAKKSEKAEIIRQLLALSEHENRIAAAAPPVRSRVPPIDHAAQRGKFPKKATGKTSQSIR